jgi:hypothetical protein
MTGLQLLGAMACGFSVALVYAAYYLHKDSRRHQLSERHVRCVACDRFRPVSQAREVKRPLVLPGRPMWLEPVWVCRECESTKEAA